MNALYKRNSQNRGIQLSVMGLTMNIYLCLIASGLIFQSEKTQGLPLLANIFVPKQEIYQMSQWKENEFIKENYSDLLRITKHLIQDATKNLQNTENIILSHPKYG